MGKTSVFIAVTVLAMSAMLAVIWRLTVEISELNQEVAVLKRTSGDFKLSDSFVLGANDQGQWISRRVRSGLEDKTSVDCGSGEDAAVVLVFGQSNGSNEGETPFKARDSVVNFNYIDGKCYLAHDPLLGASGVGGSFLSRFGDFLVERGLYRRVILVPLSVGASYLADWAPGGQFYRRILIAIEKLKKRGIAVTHILFHQGESDAGAGTDPKYYRALFLSTIDSLRREGVLAPVFVAVATVCGGRPYPAIRAVQKALPDPVKGIYPGPDTDTLGLEMRFDGCHFSSRGLDRHAEMWLQAIKN